MEGGIDPSNPESIQQLLGSGVLEPEETPEQQMALRRLETLLALVEGWVDSVVAAAAADRLPGYPALAETMRRRRASGGPAEQTFATLVGLELRPRRLREAAALWAALGEERGIAGRDAIWQHPDLLPTAEDLDDPAGFSARRRQLEASDSKVDEALQKLLDGGFDEQQPGTGDAGGGTGTDKGDDGGQDPEGR